MFRSLALVFLVVAPPVSSIISPDNIRVLISLIVLAAALWVILSNKYAPKVEHWAYATIGTIVGFWLRGS